MKCVAKVLYMPQSQNKLPHTCHLLYPKTLSLKRQSPVNVQGAHWAMDYHVHSSFTPLSDLFDMVLFLEDTHLTDMFSTEQTVSSASLKCGRSSHPVLHSINKTHKKDMPSVSDQILEHTYIHHINQEREFLIVIGVAPGKSKYFQVIPALLDSRGNAIFINDVTKQLGLLLEALAQPIRIFNADGSWNSVWDVTHAVNITIDSLRHGEELAPQLCSLNEEDKWNVLEWIHQAKVEALAKKPVCTPEELVPPCYHHYLDIFSEKASSWFLLQKP